MFNEEVKLISQTFTVNEAGDSVATESVKSVLAKRKSIGLKRKMEALEAQLKLAFVFILPDEYEYSNEEILEYNGTRYNIVNTFINEFRQVELTTAVY